jgi:uncharacterized membrane protein
VNGAHPLRLAVLGLSVAGVAVSGYLVSVHYERVPLTCSTTGVVDCRAVLHSRYASVAGVPVALLGVIWFAVAGAAALRPVSRLTLAWAALGVLAVLWLLVVELFLVDRICLWCTAAHVLALATSGLFLLQATRPARAA